MERREIHPDGPVLEILNRGTLELQGLVPWSSNYTFLVTATHRDTDLVAVYKPQEGERPLWDFDSGTLCQREVAAFLISLLLGWPDVPPVVLREDGPYGAGSVQLFVEHDRRAHYFSLRGEPARAEALKKIAVYDYVVNNADRKAGHVLAGLDGRLWAIDHGLTFHEQDKLRTVIWDWSSEPIPAPWLADLSDVSTALQTRGGEVVGHLGTLITEREWQALLRRLRRVLSERVLPRPRRNCRNVPYPLV